MRIQFWGPADDPGEDLGAAYCEDICLAGTIGVVLVREGGNVTSTLDEAAAELRPGDLMSSDFIRYFGSYCQSGTTGATCRAHLLKAVPLAFLAVSAAEHHLVPSADEPGGMLAVQVACSLSVPTASVTQEARDALTVAFTAMGWTVEGLADEREAAARASRASWGGKRARILYDHPHGHPWRHEGDDLP